jgi:hypothetical protein
MQNGKKKLVLDHLIVQKMDDNKDTEDVKSILMYGARALFEEGGESAGDIVCRSKTHGTMWSRCVDGSRRF